MVVEKVQAIEEFARLFGWKLAQLFAGSWVYRGEVAPDRHIAARRQVTCFRLVLCCGVYHIQLSRTQRLTHTEGDALLGRTQLQRE